MRHPLVVAVLALFSLLFSKPATAQPCAPRNLVFEGAGIRGLAYAGTLQVLEERQLLAGVQQVGGTSAGALTALMVSLGYSSAEIADMIASTEFRRFNDGRFFFMGGLVRMNKVYGWYRGRKLGDWIGQLVEAKAGDADLTFAQLHERGFKDLYVTGTCLNRQQLLVFSNATYPGMKVRDAVRISVSIPLYFQAVFIDSLGQSYRRPQPNLDVVVDGGITGNFPIFIFDSTFVDASRTPQRVANPQTLGIRIDSEPQIRADASDRELAPIPITEFSDYMAAFYNYVLENLNRPQLTDTDWARTVSVSSVGMNPRIRGLSAEQKARLVASGRTGITRYLEAHCP